MCERIGAIPAPPPINTISASVSFAKNSPNGPEMVTLSPGFNDQIYDDMTPGGACGTAGGGVAIRTLA